MSRENLSYTTALAYLSMLKRIRARWGESTIDQVKPCAVAEWLKNMSGAPKTKGNIKALLHRVFEKAMLWEEFEFGRNPMELVEVKGVTKRTKKAVVLTVEQFYLVLDLQPEPYRDYGPGGAVHGASGRGDPGASLGEHSLRHSEHAGGPRRCAWPRPAREDGIFGG